MPSSTIKPITNAPHEVSLDQVFTEIGTGYFHHRLFWVSGLGFAAAAIEVVFLGFALPELRAGWHLSEYQVGLLPTVVGIGSMIGQLTLGPIADAYGRRPVFLGTVLVVVIFGMCSALAPNITWLCIIRIFVSVGYGGNIAVDFTLVSEFLSTEGRASMLFCMAFMWPLGQLLTCIFAWVFIPLFGWRGFAVACVAPTLLICFLRPLIPESPRWLLLNGHTKEAVQVCEEIATVCGKSPESVGLGPGAILTLNNETSDMNRSNIDSTTQVWEKTLKLFTGPLLRTTVGVMALECGLSVAGYGCGTFMPSFLAMKGIPSASRYSTMLAMSGAQIVGVAGMYIISDSCGRLVLIPITLICTSLCLFGFGIATTQTAVLISSCCASCFLEGGYALFYVYVPEVYPTELRATACGSLSTIGSVATGLVPMMTAYLISQGSLLEAILFFCILTIAMGFVCFLCLHIETAGHNLPDRSPTLKRAEGSSLSSDAAVRGGATA